MKKKINKNFIIFILLFILFILYLLTENVNKARLKYSEFLKALEENQVKEIVIRNKEIYGIMRNGEGFRASGLIYESTIEKMQENGVSFDIALNASLLGSILGIFMPWIPIFILGWWLFSKQMKSGGSGAFGFGKSKLQLFIKKDSKITFADVAGIDEAKEELEELVEFLKNPDKFVKLGCKIPKGCLLIGEPGTGKTLLAKAIAGEAGVPFLSISGSDFVEMFVGVGASRVRDMFEQGKKNAPCIIFIDEIDAVARHRGVNISGGNDEREQTLNQLLVEMDGFNSNKGIIIIAATNRPDVLDKALLRPGRFDRRINVSMPDMLGREKILQIHSKSVPLAPDVNIGMIARSTSGFSGADLQNLINESALIAGKNNQKRVTMANVESSKDKILMGAERKSMSMTKEDRDLTAYHEAGHALVSVMIKSSDPIHKATIIPRGRALGVVVSLPKVDRHSLRRDEMLASLAKAMGGRAAELIVFGQQKVTSGAESDIKQATYLATAMVTKWGMSDVVGNIFCGDDSSNTKDIKEYLSDSTLDLISSEIKMYVDLGYKEALDIIANNRTSLDRLAEALLKFETITGDEIEKIVNSNENIEDIVNNGYNSTNNNDEDAETSFNTILG